MQFNKLFPFDFICNPLFSFYAIVFNPDMRETLDINCTWYMRRVLITLALESSIRRVEPGNYN